MHPHTCQIAQQVTELAYAYGSPCWLTTSLSSISHWRNHNHEPLISLLGPRPLFLLSIEASAILGLNSIPVTKTSLLIYPKDRGSSNHRHHTIATTVPIANTSLHHTLPPHLLATRQRLQNAITQLTTTAVIGNRRWCRMWG